MRAPNRSRLRLLRVRDVNLPAPIRALRPHQWTKNLFVFAPLLFEARFSMLDSGRNLRTVAVFAIFCALASGVYLLNDVLDREADRLHPRKRNRPIASGEIPVPAALCGSAALVLGGLAWAHFGLCNNTLTGVLVTYVAVQVAYTLKLKRVAFVDVLCIASGFVLRLLAGATSAWVQQSAWILVCTIFVSLFLALCKRRHEVTSLGEGAASHRAILADYPTALLDQLIGIAATGTLVTYVLYTVDERTIAAHGLLWHGHPAPVLLATVPCVIYGIFRYLLLVYVRAQGGSPTSTLLRDVPSLVNGLLFLGAVMGIFAAFRS